jgi:hypothetical protein
LGVPAGLADQDCQVPGGLGSDERMAARVGGEPGSVGGHPPELLVVEFDQHVGGQEVHLREQRMVIGVVPVCGERVSGADQLRKSGSEVVVSAGVEVGEGAGQVAADPVGR